jgi:methylmalonyl-CoA mutase N-terminal domain/subunit
MKERFHATNPEVMKLRFHAQTGGSTLTAQQIDNNVVRVTLQALAAVLGGCQSLHTNSRDEALALPTEASASVALRTQQIIAYESGVADTIDPLGGSYLIESLTDAIERGAADLIAKVGDLGGAVSAIEKQFYQTEIARSAYRYQQAIESGDKVVVGMNKFVSEPGPTPETLTIDERIAAHQIDRLTSIRSRRNAAAVQRALDALRSAAAGTHNLLPLILEAVEQYASIGEISDALRQVWGEYRE